MKDEQETRGHDRFSELCALAMSGSLTTAENEDLQRHMQSCADCHDEYARYLLLTREGMPLLAQRYAGRETREELIPELAGDDGLDSASIVAREKIFARIALAEPSLPSRSLAESEPARNFSFPVHWHALIKPLSAAIAACLLIVGSYVFYQSLQHKDVAAQHRIETLASEKVALADQLSAQTKQLGQLELDASQKRQEIEQLQAELRTELQRETQQASEQASALSAAKALSEERLRSAAHDRETLAARLNELEAAYKNAQAELVNLRTEKDRTTLRLASLENENAALTASSRDQERTLPVRIPDR